MKGLRNALAPLALVLIAAAPAAGSWEEAMAAFNERRYAEAAAGFAAGAEASPDDPRWHYMLGVSLLKGGRPGEAVPSLERALALEPAIGHALSLAQAQLRTGAPAAALATLDRHRPAADADAETTASWAGLIAVAAGTAEEPAAGLPLLAAAIERRPAAPDLRLVLGRVHSRAGDHAAAFEAYAAAFEIGGEPAAGDRGVAAAGPLAIRAAFAAAKADEAGRQEWYRRAAEIAGRLPVEGASAATLLLAGDALLLGERAADAEPRFAAAAAAEPGSAEARYQLARSRLALGDAEGALGHLRDALARGPDSDLERSILGVQGRALADLERFADAADSFRRAGDAARAAQMDEAVAAAAHNAEIDRARDRCRLEWERIALLRERNRDVEGTSAWAEIDRQAARLEAECGPPPERAAPE
jgi:tetratricopeptide (TPR) repeat protein